MHEGPSRPRDQPLTADLMWTWTCTYTHISTLPRMAYCVHSAATHNLIFCGQSLAMISRQTGSRVLLGLVQEAADQHGFQVGRPSSWLTSSTSLLSASAAASVGAMTAAGCALVQEGRQPAWAREVCALHC